MAQFREESSGGGREPAPARIGRRGGRPQYPRCIWGRRRTWRRSGGGDQETTSVQIGNAEVCRTPAFPILLDSTRGDGSPSSGEETAFRFRSKKQRRVGVRRWIPRRLLCEFRGNARAAFMAYAEEEGNARAALKEAEEDKKASILKEGCLDDEELLMDQSALHASRSSSKSGDALEEAPFDREETNLLLKMDKKPKPCFGDPDKIAQDEEEDGYSDNKKPLAVVEDEQSDKTVAHTTDEDHKQEQGRARGNVQDLLKMDRDTICDMTLEFEKLLNYDPPVRDYNLELNDDQLTELHKQLALYRIRAYKLTENSELVKLDDVDLEREYSLSTLCHKGFFRHYEESFEWYFDPQLCWHARYDNYQRLTLRFEDEYADYHDYRSIRNTYEEDLAYVRYFKALAKKTKWIEDYLGDSTIERDKIKSVGCMQSTETAADFPNVSPLLVFHCFSEYFSSIWYDCDKKRLSVAYFKIWKLLAKGKSFEEAVLEVKELKNTRNLNLIENRYNARVAGIDKMALDDEARQAIRKAIIRLDPKLKYYIDYAMKKVEIAAKIGLIPKGSRGVVAKVEEIDD